MANQPESPSRMMELVSSPGVRMMQVLYLCVTLMVAFPWLGAASNTSEKDARGKPNETYILYDKSFS